MPAFGYSYNSIAVRSLFATLIENHFYPADDSIFSVTFVTLVIALAAIVRVRSTPLARQRGAQRLVTGIAAEWTKHHTQIPV